MLFSIVSEILNLRSCKTTIPDLVSDVYDQDSYVQQQNYQKEKIRFGIIETVINSSIIIFMFTLKGFGLVHNIIENLTSNTIYQSLLFFGILALLTLIISIPFSYYDKFVIEEKYGFNRSTKKLFITDTFKSLLITILLGGLTVWITSWLFYYHYTVFWIATLSFFLIFSLLMNALYSSVILPIFNKKKPIDDQNLKQKIQELSSLLGFSINNIYIIDGSKRSSKANAFFTGFGKQKRVFLYDTLINKLNDDEVLAVMAHELGHYKKHHVWLNLLIGMSQLAFFIYLFNLISKSPVFSQVMGVNVNFPVFHLCIICLALLIEPIQLIIGIANNYISKTMEYSADRFATHLGMGNALITGLKKLSSMNYSNLTPNDIYVAIYYSHPTLYKRIQRIFKNSAP